MAIYLCQATVGSPNVAMFLVSIPLYQCIPVLLHPSNPASFAPAWLEGGPSHRNLTATPQALTNKSREYVTYNSGYMRYMIWYMKMKPFLDRSETFTDLVRRYAATISWTKNSLARPSGSSMAVTATHSKVKAYRLSSWLFSLTMEYHGNLWKSPISTSLVYQSLPLPLSLHVSWWDAKKSPPWVPTFMATVESSSRGLFSFSNS
jgi:hypothetical protein